MLDAPSHGRFAWLLIALIAWLAISPLFAGLTVGGEIGRGFGSFLLLVAAYISYRHDIRPVAIAVAIAVLVWLTLTWTGLAVGARAQPILIDGLFVVVLTVTITDAFRRILRAPTVTFDILCGGVSVYLLLAVIWSVIFRLLEGLAPGSFSLPETDIYANLNQFTYFSLTTLTTLGYGDITPLTPTARIWAALEAVTGVLYLAVLVARLVSLYRPRA